MTRSISNLRIEKESPLRWRTRHLWALSRRCWRLASERLYIHSGVMLAFLYISGSLGVCCKVPICIWDIGARRIKSEYYIYIYVKALITTNHVSELGFWGTVCARKPLSCTTNPRRKAVCTISIIDTWTSDISQTLSLHLDFSLNFQAMLQSSYATVPLHSNAG
jgi:hypothetical protein